MFIVDSQVHLWKEETADRPWLPGARERIKLQGHMLERFTYEECVRRMDEAGVNRVVIVPPSWEGDRIDYALEACEKYPHRFGIMARIPQNKPEEAKAMLRDWKTIPYIKGTRLTFHRPIDRNWMIDGTCDWYWPFAEQHGIKTMVNTPIWKAEIGAIAKKHPKLTIICDQMGVMSRTVDDAIGFWVEETADLCVHPNIYVKLCSLPAYSTHPYPYHNLTKYVRLMVDKMGPKRCFWGSDLTRLLHRGITYKDTVDHFTKHMGFTGQELEWIMGRGICECLDWPIDE
ncbi:MAG: amidohydrolase [Betaproteobacteria bacterium RIFCSPLOWO2_12_FULL_62_58]|nr:MAG: amidohydrolase [Betaproteobacteria bacterium RIFCSPLOWO2_12_FULL_62_58]